MILISHRGNLNGANPNRENSKSYVEEALTQGYDVEVDIWLKDDKIYLGHDEPQYVIDEIWLYTNKNNLWLHCKNIDAINFFIKKLNTFNFFWHESDTISITSKRYIWVYPGKQPIKNSIAVMPEIYNDKITECIGICSDYIKKYK